jgi:hypothetical protein
MEEMIVIPQPTLLERIFRFYVQGFRRMTVGKTLWKIIIIKLFILFAVLKLFFFPDFLGTQFNTNEQRADYVLEQLTAPIQAQPVTQGGK